MDNVERMIIVMQNCDDDVNVQNEHHSGKTMDGLEGASFLSLRI